MAFRLAPTGRKLGSAGEQVLVGDGGGHMELYESPRAVLPDGYASHPQRDGLGREDECHPIGEPARVTGGPARRRARLEGDSAMLAKAVVQPLRDIRVTREPLLGAIADDRGCLVFDENELATATVSPAFMAASHAMASCSTSGDRSMHPPRPRQATFVDSRPETSAGAYQSRCWPPGGAVPAAFHGSMRLTPMPVKSEVLRVASVAFRTRQIAAI